MTDDDGEPMAECEGGCKTWVHLKCHRIKLGEDWFCDECQQAIQTSKAPSDDLNNPMEEPADANRASPCNAPSSDAPAESTQGGEKGRTAPSSPADRDLAEGPTTSPGTSKEGMRATSNSPATNKEGVKATASSPDSSCAAEDIEVDLSPAGSPAPKSSSKKSKKVTSFLDSSPFVTNGYSDCRQGNSRTQSTSYNATTKGGQAMCYC